MTDAAASELDYLNQEWPDALEVRVYRQPPQRKGGVPRYVFDVLCPHCGRWHAHLVKIGDPAPDAGEVWILECREPAKG